MKKQKLFSILIAAIGIAFIQGCKLERMDPQCPTVTGIMPNAAGFDDTVSIKGTNFLPGLPQLYKVSIGDATLEAKDIIDVPDEKTLRFRVPSGIGTGSISVSLASGTVCNSANTITFIYQLKVTEIKPFASGFNSPAGMDVDANGNVILADRFNHVIYQITPNNNNTPVISTIAGKITQSGTADNNYGTSVQFNSPDDVAVDAEGYIYVADDYNCCIRKISIDQNRTVRTVAGTINGPGDNDGTPLAAKFYRPRGVAVNGTSLFVIEYTYGRLRCIDFTANTVTTPIHPMPALKFPLRVAYSDKRHPEYPILIADRDNKRILEVNASGVINNNPITLPFSPWDLAVDETGNIIVLDRDGKRVSVIYKNNTRTDIAGSFNYIFKVPSGLAIDTKNKIIYISDEGLQSVVKAKYE